MDWVEAQVLGTPSRTAPVASYRSEDEAGKRDEQANTDSARNANTERATGLATSNFDEVGQLSDKTLSLKAPNKAGKYWDSFTNL